MFTRASILLLALPLACLADDAKITFLKAASNESVDLKAGDELVARFHIGPSVAKPYFWPVHAPGGVPVTRAWPMKKGSPGETTDDHVHQKSAWFCHGDVIPEGLSVFPSSDKRVKGVDFWSETPGHGVIKVVSSSPDGKTYELSWTDSKGKKILDEVRALDAVILPGGGRLLVMRTTLTASVCPITFGDTKEGSFGVRVHDQMRLAAKGEKNRMVTSSGGDGDKTVWGSVADWCDYSGLVGGKHVGIAIFSHPSNSSPASWHSRGYGLMAANPFGRNGAGFPAMKGKTDLLKIAKGESLTLVYGLYLHTGDSVSGKVAEAYATFRAMVK